MTYFADGIDDYDVEWPEGSSLGPPNWYDIYANSFPHMEFILNTPVPEEYKMKGFVQWRY